MTTFAPGIYEGIPMPVYREAEGVNHSAAKEIDISPRHYLQLLTADKKEPTPAQVIGTIFHSAVLEQKFSEFVIRPAGMIFTTKEGKDWRDKQTKPIIDQETACNINGMVASVRNHPLASTVLYGNGNSEVSAWKKDIYTELVVKGRADRITMDKENKMVIADLKTCGRGEASDSEFSRAIYNWRYHSQAAWYLNLFEASFFVFVCVEKEAPFAVNCFCLDQESLKIGGDLNAKRLSKIRECQDSGVWPAYSETLKTISIPDWAKKKAQEL